MATSNQTITAWHNHISKTYHFSTNNIGNRQTNIFIFFVSIENAHAAATKLNPTSGIYHCVIKVTEQKLLPQTETWGIPRTDKVFQSSNERLTHT